MNFCLFCEKKIEFFIFLKSIRGKIWKKYAHWLEESNFNSWQVEAEKACVEMESIKKIWFEFQTKNTKCIPAGIVWQKQKKKLYTYTVSKYERKKI